MEYTVLENNYPLIRPVEYLDDFGQITKSVALFLNEQELINFKTFDEAKSFAWELIDQGKVDNVFILVEDELCYA